MISDNTSRNRTKESEDGNDLNEYTYVVESSARGVHYVPVPRTAGHLHCARSPLDMENFGQEVLKNRLKAYKSLRQTPPYLRVRVWRGYRASPLINPDFVYERHTLKPSQ